MIKGVGLEQGPLMTLDEYNYTVRNYHFPPGCSIQELQAGRPLPSTHP